MSAVDSHVRFEVAVLGKGFAVSLPSRELQLLVPADRKSARLKFASCRIAPSNWAFVKFAFMKDTCVISAWSNTALVKSPWSRWARTSPEPEKSVLLAYA